MLIVDVDAVYRSVSELGADGGLSVVRAGHRFIDVLILGWDLDVATGQDSMLDSGLAQTCWEVVRPQRNLLRGSGAFGTEVQVPDDAASQTRLLTVLGRRAPA